MKRVKEKNPSIPEVMTWLNLARLNEGPIMQIVQGDRCGLSCVFGRKGFRIVLTALAQQALSQAVSQHIKRM
jgi:hypothetical protein